ncbi:carboxymethylenebutenolidase [Granulicella rosea]|uniref:Carboxymethylenebutenolidase n=1 Tax=Granulicella rosea TaxID=474952 RepID=A0A239H3S2_9BACT|nr:dienelactone hydrolase family protein [Granulicella rosea]SNS75678.1 carboxymethylenebutenolidase [Granulicella rosea]
MGEFKQLTAADGHTFNAYQASPEGEPIGAILLLQEIFGVNAHIRSVADGYAKEGYLVLAPAMFDRIERNVDLSYEPEDMQKAFALYAPLMQLTPDATLLDVAATYAELKKAGKGIAVIGFCWGGLMTWLTATRGETVQVQPSCCVGYYAGGIGNYATEEPSCPVMLHFGAEDTHIGSDQIEAVRAAHPEVEIYVYEGAGHAFNRDVHPASYSPAAAALAKERTLAFLKANIS